MTMSLSVSLSILKVIWLAADPYSLKNYLPRMAERLLDEITYSILFAIYAVILIVWYSIYETI